MPMLLALLLMGIIGVVCLILGWLARVRWQRYVFERWESEMLKQMQRRP